MSWSFPIGHLLGSELRVHATFFLLLLWIGVSAYADGGAMAAVWNIAFILSLFACVVAHEFGHALMARRYGIRTPDITLLPIGGLARLERMPEKPGQEIAVALAGPAVNVVIWGVLTVVFGAQLSVAEIENIDTPASNFLGQLAMVNLFLVLFNMIPAFPMDGGRVFRALLSIPLDRVRATTFAARAGQALAFGFGLWGLVSGNLFLLLIAVFIFAAAQAEASDVSMTSGAKGLRARDAMITEYEAFHPHDGVEAMSSALLRTSQHEFPVLGEEGAFLGMVTRDAIYRASREDRMATAGAVMADIPALPLDAALIDVMRALQGGRVPGVAITDRRDMFLGYVTRENIGELMVLRGG